MAAGVLAVSATMAVTPGVAHAATLRYSEMRSWDDLHHRAEYKINFYSDGHKELIIADKRVDGDMPAIRVNNRILYWDDDDDIRYGSHYPIYYDVDSFDYCLNVDQDGITYCVPW
ncbi:hypothetical protein BG844_33820 [Couchioplanes caeruleus subsp. caeruleus]|uniref:Uncharacterized protein n=1 Tax=Couchioplanes caeruleus subsp. caeruleus TaxID=56427 RepID=A0A1K0GLR9_9ACTN|nr:hypothetical protein BG844_33820 [Couchioplanes caeruleus subsp. caeruleus]